MRYMYPHVYPAVILQASERDVTVAHKSEQDSLQHTDRVISNTSGYMCRDLLIKESLDIYIDTVVMLRDVNQAYDPLLSLAGTPIRSEPI